MIIQDSQRSESSDELVIKALEIAKEANVHPAPIFDMECYLGIKETPKMNRNEYFRETVEECAKKIVDAKDDKNSLRRILLDWVMCFDY